MRRPRCFSGLEGGGCELSIQRTLPRGAPHAPCAANERKERFAPIRSQQRWFAMKPLRRLTPTPRSLTLSSSAFGLPSPASVVFWVCGGMEMIERLAYYGVRAVATLYATRSQSEGGLGVTMATLGTLFLFWNLVQSFVPSPHRRPFGSLWLQADDLCKHDSKGSRLSGDGLVSQLWRVLRGRDSSCDRHCDF